MMSKDENGDIVITLVEGREEVPQGQIRPRRLEIEITGPQRAGTPRQTTKLADGPPGSGMSPSADDTK